MNERTRLERAAIRAHTAGMTWAEFWETHRHTVGQIEPHDRRRFYRLVRRLTALVAAGDAAGDGASWESDDQATYPANNSTTVARIDWSAAGVVPVAAGRPKA